MNMFVRNKDITKGIKCECMLRSGRVATKHVFVLTRVAHVLVADFPPCILQGGGIEIRAGHGAEIDCINHG